MADQQSTTTVKLNFDLGGDAAGQLQAMTEQTVKLTKAEQDYQRQLSQANRDPAARLAHTLLPPAVQAPAPTLYEQSPRVDVLPGQPDPDANVPVRGVAGSPAASAPAATRTGSTTPSAPPAGPMREYADQAARARVEVERLVQVQEKIVPATPQEAVQRAGDAVAAAATAAPGQQAAASPTTTPVVRTPATTTPVVPRPTAPPLPPVAARPVQGVPGVQPLPPGTSRLPTGEIISTVGPATTVAPGLLAQQQAALGIPPEPMALASARRSARIDLSPPDSREVAHAGIGSVGVRRPTGVDGMAGPHQGQATLGTGGGTPATSMMTAVPQALGGDPAYSPPTVAMPPVDMAVESARATPAVAPLLADPDRQGMGTRAYAERAARLAAAGGPLQAPPRAAVAPAGMAVPPVEAAMAARVPEREPSQFQANSKTIPGQFLDNSARTGRTIYGEPLPVPEQVFGHTGPAPLASVVDHAVQPAPFRSARRSATIAPPLVEAAPTTTPLGLPIPEQVLDHVGPAPLATVVDRAVQPIPFKSARRSATIAPPLVEPIVPGAPGGPPLAGQGMPRSAPRPPAPVVDQAIASAEVEQVQQQARVPVAVGMPGGPPLAGQGMGRTNPTRTVPAPVPAVAVDQAIAQASADPARQPIPQAAPGVPASPRMAASIPLPGVPGAAGAAGSPVGTPGGSRGPTGALGAIPVQIVGPLPVPVSIQGQVGPRSGPGSPLPPGYGPPGAAGVPGAPGSPGAPGAPPPRPATADRAVLDEIKRLADSLKTLGRTPTRDWKAEAAKADPVQREVIRDHLRQQESGARQDRTQQTRQALGIDKIDAATEAERRQQQELRRTREEVERLTAALEKRQKAGTLSDAGQVSLARAKGAMAGPAARDPGSLEAMRQDLARNEQQARQQDVARANKTLGINQASFADRAVTFAQTGSIMQAAGGNTAGAAAAAGGGGAVAMAGMAAAGAMASIKALESGMNGLALVMNTLGDTTLTAHQQMRRLESSIPVLGNLATAWHGLVDAATGTTGRLKTQGQKHEVDRAQLMGDAGVKAQETQMNYERALAGNKAQVYGAAVTSQLQTFSRDTIQSDIAYQEYQQRLPALDQKVRAERDVEVGKLGVDTAKERAHKATSELAAAERNRNAAMKAVEAQKGILNRDKNEVGWAPTALFGAAFGGNPLTGLAGASAGKVKADVAGSKATADYDAALKNADLANQDVANKAKAAQDALNAAKQQGLELTKAESEARKAGIALAQQDLAIAQAKEQRMRNASTRIGGMTEVDRELGLEAARSIRDRGIENVTLEERQAAEAFAPEWVQKQKELYGETTDEYRKAQAEGFLADKGTIKQQAEVTANLQQDVRVKVDVDAKATAQAVNEELRKSIPEIVAALVKGVNAEVADIKIKQMHGNMGPR